MEKHIIALHPVAIIMLFTKRTEKKVIENADENDYENINKNDVFCQGLQNIHNKNHCGKTPTVSRCDGGGRYSVVKKYGEKAASSLGIVNIENCGSENWNTPRRANGALCMGGKFHYRLKTLKIPPKWVPTEL